MRRECGKLLSNGEENQLARFRFEKNAGDNTVD